MMRGDIGVRSKLGEGSVFWFTARLPRAPERNAAGPNPGDIGERSLQADMSPDQSHPGAEAGDSMSLPSAAPRPLKVLLAEDNLVNQKVASRQLRKLGYQAHMVCNGREVLAALERERFDVILMDCHMPEMDGYAATRAIRARERSEGESGATQPIRIVAMTANAMLGDREQCLRAGMNDYISKPVRLEHLQAVLARGEAAAPVTNPAVLAEASGS
jgi:CheY-like chemotaxis protein